MDNFGCCNDDIKFDEEAPACLSNHEGGVIFSY